jgi:hypothetical protein
MSEPMNNDPEDLELDVEDDPVKKDHLSERRILSKSRVITPNSSVKSLFEWLVRLHVILDELKTRMKIKVEKTALVYYPVPENELDFSLLI